MSGKKAVVLLSGGLDSTTTLALARQRGFTPCAMTFSYGQRHQLEVAAARRIAREMGVSEQVVVEIDLRVFGGSALTAAIDVPKRDSAEGIGQTIPVTYVPARNTIFLSFALAWAEVLPARDIFIGVNAQDYSGYPDCRPQYIEAFQRHGPPGNQGRRRRRRRDDTHAADGVNEGPDHCPRAGIGGRLWTHNQLLRPCTRRCGVRPMRGLPTAATGLCGTESPGSDALRG